MDLTGFDWNHIRAFVATAETGSFSSAARKLRTTQPTIGRQIAALEERLGVTLFERIGYRLLITPAGQELLRFARKMDGAAQDIGRVAFGKSNAPAGQVTLTATDLYANRVLTPLLPELRQVAPDIQIVIMASNERFDLQKREADIALRNGEPVEPELVQTRLPDGSGKFYAAKTYVAAKGPFDHVTDAIGGDFIDIDTEQQWMGFLNSMGMGLSPANFPYQTESLNLMWEMVRGGLGIGPCDARIGDADPDVVPVFPSLPPTPIPTYLMVHRDVRTNRRVRIVFDYLVAKLSG
jgi:DNA-binding transcriptional LysR family regulator